MEGGCHCGAIRFKIAGEFSWCGTCYCLDCRKISGTTSMTFVEFDKDSFEIVQGTPKEYQSSKDVVRTFCGDCGSPISYTHAELPEKIEIPVGALDDIESIVPQEHIWVSRKPAWLPICDDLPRRE